MTTSNSNTKYPRYKHTHASGKDLHFATRCIHGGQYEDPYTGAVTVPIYATSTYKQELPEQHRGFVYAREHNPTREALERALTDLDGGARSFAFSSGMAAMSSLLDSLPAGSHVIASDDLYGGSHRMLSRMKNVSANLEVSFVDMSNPSKVKAAIKPNTKLIWIETPTNPLLKIADLAGVAAVARKHKIPSIVDNTMSTPWVQRPLDHGFDMVLYSLTKYMAGHSDMIGGAIVVGDNPEYVQKLAFQQMAIGSILGPFDSYLVLRGLKTLDLRMERQCASAMKIAAWLEQHSKIEKIYYPGLRSHPQHRLAKKQMRAFGGIISAVIKGGIRPVNRFLSKIQIFTLAESLGAVESLINHPAIMTHASIAPEIRKKAGINDGLIRLSIGIEHVDDLLADLEQALH